VNDPRGAYYGSVIAAPVFMELADKIYSTELEFHAPAQLDSTMMVEHQWPTIKGGSTNELNTLFSSLNIPVPAQPSNTWISASNENKSLVVTQRDIQAGMVPNVIGMGLQDALYLLESNGMRVKVMGYGTVKRQSIPAGATIQSNPNIIIELL
jgi:cell division protein FtsI (penicillin-binding protein 3)